MNVETTEINCGAYTVNNVLPEYQPDLANTARTVPCLDLLTDESVFASCNELCSIVLNGTLLRLDISGFSSLNDRLTAISPLETVPQRLAAFSILHSARHAQAIAYEDIAHQQAQSRASLGQQQLINTFNDRFRKIEKVIVEYGGRILNIEGDAVNVYFPNSSKSSTSPTDFFEVHHRALTAGLGIQKLFPENGDLRARIGIRPTRHNEQALLTASGKLIYLTGDPFGELCRLEAGTTVGGIGTDPYRAGLLPIELFDYDDNNHHPYRPLINLDGGIPRLAAEVDPYKFAPAKEVTPRTISLQPNQIDELLNKFEQFREKTIEVPQNIPAIVSYFAVSDIVGSTVSETLENVDVLDGVLSDIENKHNISVLKTGIDDHGNITLIALHTGESNGDETDQQADQAEVATVKAMLELETQLENTSMNLAGAGIASGTGVRTMMGAKHYVKDDIMGMTVTGAARIEQRIDRGRENRVALDMATLGRLRASGYEPIGEEVVIENVKGFPAGLRIFYIESLEKMGEDEDMLSATTFESFKTKLSNWMEENGISRNDLDSVMDLARRYCGVGMDNILTDADKDILKVTLYPLLEDLRTGATLFQIHHTLAAESTKSPTLHTSSTDLIKDYGNAVHLVSTMTGGSDIPFNVNILIAVARGLNIETEKYIQYLRNNNLIDDSNGNITIWPALQRRVYLHLTDENKKKNYHQTFANYLKSQLEEHNTPDFYRSLVFHAINAGLYELASEHLPQVIENCRRDNDWEGVMLYSEWLVEAAEKENDNNLKAFARIKQGKAFLVFGDYEQANASFADALKLTVDNNNIRNIRYSAQIEHAYTSLILGKYEPEDALEQIKTVQEELSIDISSEEVVCNIVDAYRREAEIVERFGTEDQKMESVMKLKGLYKNTRFRDRYLRLWLLIVNAYSTLTKRSVFATHSIKHLMKKLDCDDDSLLTTVPKQYPEYADALANLLLNRIKFKKTMSFDDKMVDFDLAAQYAKRSGSFRRFVYIINNRADQQIKKRQVDDNTRQSLEEGIRIAQAMNHGYFTANLRVNLGCYYLLQDDENEAIGQLKAGYNYFRDTGDNDSMNMVISDITNILDNPERII